MGGAIIDWSVPLAILFSIPIMALVGLFMERGLIKYFYKRPHADQILVTFGLAIVLQEIIKYFYGANPIPTPAPEVFAGSFDFGALIGMDPNIIIFPATIMQGIGVQPFRTDDSEDLAYTFTDIRNSAGVSRVKIDPATGEFLEDWISEGSFSASGN